MAERRNGNGIERTYGEGSSGEGAPDYSPGDNEDSEGGSSGSGWRGGNPQRSQGMSRQGSEAQSVSPEGSTGPGDAPFTRKRGPQSSTGPGASPFTAVQAPNRPK